jgi:hypothetical protein
MHSIEDKMKQLLETILEKKYDAANQFFKEEIENIQLRKLHEAKKAIAAKIGVSSFQSALDETVEVSRNLAELDVSKEKPDTEDIEDRRPTQQPVQTGKGDKVEPSKETVITKNNLKEDELLDEARVKLIKARVRGGKIQRRKKVSNVQGYTLRGGKLKRMSAMERRKRKLGQKRGKIKRRTKMRQTLMKRKRSLRKRASIGL